jgi:TRAP-type mannitol/chloroaromatic compound transport system substrate-binding protein
MINQKAFDALPADLQQIVLTCCHAINEQMYAEFIARNNEALQTLVNEHGVILKQFPDAVLKKLRALSAEVIADGVAKDPLYARVYESVSAFQKRSASYLKVAELSYLQARDL